jgi:hypothetical protein
LDYLYFTRLLQGQIISAAIRTRTDKKKKSEYHKGTNTTGCVAKGNADRNLMCVRVHLVKVQRQFSVKRKREKRRTSVFLSLLCSSFLNKGKLCGIGFFTEGLSLQNNNRTNQINTQQLLEEFFFSVLSIGGALAFSSRGDVSEQTSEG